MRLIKSVIVIILLTGSSAYAADFSYDKEIAHEEAQAVTPSKNATASEKEQYTIEDCIKIALEQNSDIKTAKNRIEEQQGVTLEAKAFLLPKIEAHGAYNQVEQEALPLYEGVRFGSDKSWQADIRLVQPIYTGGRGTALREQASFLEKASMHELQTVINDIIYQVKKTFYDILLSRAKTEVRKQSVDLLTQQLDFEKNKLEAGTVSEFNVLRAEVELANAQTPLIKARNDLRLSIEELSRILGYSSRNPENVKFALKIIGELKYEDLELNLKESLEVARSKRPELKRLGLLKKAQMEGVDIARAGYLPRVQAFGGYDWHSNQFEESLSEVDNGWLFGVESNWRLFDSFETQGKVIQAKARERRVDIFLKQELLNIDVEVRRSLSEMVEARELVYASNKVVEQAEESLRLVHARNEAGAARQIDVLDTQVALTDARTNHVEALHSYNVARAKLKRAIGSY